MKIGCTDDLARRKAELEYHYGRRLSVLATIEGDTATETEVHRRFAHIRIDRLEQFQPATDLMAFIGRPERATDRVHKAMKPARVDTNKTTYIDDQICRDAKLIAFVDGVKLPDYLNCILAPIIKRDLEKVMKRVMERAKDSED